MNKLMQGIERFWKDEEGAEVVEWVLICSLIVAAAVGLFATLGTTLSDTMDFITGAFAPDTTT